MIETKAAHRRYKGVEKVSRRPAFPGYVFMGFRRAIDWVSVKQDSRVFGPLMVKNSDPDRCFEDEPFQVSPALLDTVRDQERGNFEVQRKAPPSTKLPLIGEEVLVPFGECVLRFVVAAVKDGVVHLGHSGKVLTPLTISTERFMAMGAVQRVAA